MAILLGCALAAPAPGYTSARVGVDSNFLVHGGRVYFVQADGSLTALDLETGAVLLRKTDFTGAQSLHRTDAGILALSYRDISLLSPRTLAPVWSAGNAYDTCWDADRLVSHDGNGLVKCRDLRDGRVLWSYDLPGALDLTLVDGRVLVFRAATYDGPERPPAVVLLDVQTGRELLHKTTPPGVHYLAAFFDGERIYLPAGTYGASHSADSADDDRGRPSARFERLMVWDLAGNELQSTPNPNAEDSRRGSLSDSEVLVFAGKVFARGTVWDSVDAVPAWSPGGGKRVKDDPAGGVLPPPSTATRFDLPGGTIIVTYTPEPAMRSWARRGHTVSVRFESPGGNWSGKLPYLGDDGHIDVAAGTVERVLLGSDRGHVECIEAATGRSRWIYVFPMLRQTLSYSSRGMPPRMAEAAALHRRENADRPPPTGFVRDGATHPPPTVVTDPSPIDPFPRLALYLAIAWSAALLPIGLAGMVGWGRRIRGWDPRLCAILGVAIMLLAIAAVWFAGRVSSGSNLAQKAAILVAAGGTVASSLACIREGRWGTGYAVLIGLAVAAVLVWPLLLYG